MSTLRNDYYARVWHSDGKRYKQKVWTGGGYSSRVQEWIIKTTLTGGSYGADHPGVEHGECPPGAEKDVGIWKVHKPEKYRVTDPVTGEVRRFTA